MDTVVKTTFNHIDATPKGHFILYFYAAVFHLLNYIQGLSEHGGTDLDTLFKRYPFLSEYYNEMRAYMPDDISWQAAAEWWLNALQEWEYPCEDYLPLKALQDNADLQFDHVLAFILNGLVEEDSRFGTVFAELQQPLAQRRPTLELVGQIVSSGKLKNTKDSWGLSQTLIDTGLLTVMNKQEPRSEWLLHVPSLLWNAARGEINPKPVDGLQYLQAEQFPEISDLIYTEELINRLHQLSGLLDESKINRLLLRSHPGCDAVEVIGAVAKSLGLNIVTADGADESAQLLGPFCTMTHSLPVVHYSTTPGQTITPIPLDGYQGPVCYLLGLEGGIENNKADKSLTLTLPQPDKQLRARYWRRVLKDTPVEDFESITAMFRVAGGYIQELGHVAQANARLNARQHVCLTDVQEASRALNRQHLDALADRLETLGSWHDLVASQSSTDKLLELERRCRHREGLVKQLAPAFGNGVNQGVRALFTGASGTGKTLAAKILAAELGMDLYRVDLAAVVNKYIGETEKNLHQVLTHAEALDVVLLLDEGDSLLGGRTDVKSANDRYANLETNYLLQRLENYQGIVLITSNLVENIDRAFQRRMDVLVPFFPPQAEQRLKILELHLPEDHDVDFDYLYQVASRCVFTGGQIRNACLHATLLAMENNSVLTHEFLEEALRSEFRKAGATYPINNVVVKKDSEMDAFINALSGHQ